jgi:hypothetical protein
MLSHLARALSLLFCIQLHSVAEFGVTYDFSGGRFGDCLLSYLHAKWLAHTKNIPLIYRPFIYSKYLVLDEKERALTDLGAEPRMRVYWGNGINPNISLPLLYICPYFPEDLWEIHNTKRSDGIGWIHFQADWKNPQFRQAVREMVSPKKPLTLIEPPKSRLSIAIHVREGGGYDGNDRYDVWPLKFPRIRFYIESLQSVIYEHGEKPLYCFVFTDAEHPSAIVEQIQNALPREIDIIFDWRKKNNSHSANVLEDFFSFFNFDILIRPQSNFSLIPSLLHDYLAVYSPEMEPVGRQIVVKREVK